MLPIAALFAIMTKIGIYAMLRVSSHGLSAAPFSSDLLQPWLAWLAIATIALGAFGALAARHLSTVVAHLVVISSGTLLLALVQSGARANAALLFYLVHTTVVTGALFLLADAIARRRGSMGDVIDKGPRIGNFMTLGAAFIVLGVAASGAPPLTGFLGKLMILQSLQGSGTPLAWSVILVSGFVVALAFARSASAIFWEPGRPSPRGVVPEVQHPGLSAGLLLLVIAALALFIYAAPIASYARAASEQLEQRQAYVSAVIGRPADIKRQKRP
jgi:multicomponent K+:H+ antiporter subunit D